MADELPILEQREVTFYDDELPTGKYEDAIGWLGEGLQALIGEGF